MGRNQPSQNVPLMLQFVLLGVVLMERSGRRFWHRNAWRLSEHRQWRNSTVILIPLSYQQESVIDRQQAGHCPLNNPDAYLLDTLSL